MRISSVLLIEANESLLSKFEQLRLREGFELARGNRATYKDDVDSLEPDLVVVGSKELGVVETMAVVQGVRRVNARIPVILTPSRSSEDLAIAALKAGVNDYLRPSASVSDIARSLRRYLPGGCEDHFIGESAALNAIRQRIRGMAPSHSNVLITGETGTGKELIAEMVHASGSRSQRPMVCVNCAAIPETLFESELFGYERGAFTGALAARQGKLREAHGGTIFLDEVGDMTPFAQAKILRAVESKQVQPLGGNSSIPLDVRVIAATNQNLDQMMCDGKFRKDLYFRLDVIHIHVPPLRERREDIPLLIGHYAKKFASFPSGGISMLSDEALDGLLRYDWPGNVRELKNVLESVFVTARASKISFTDLPERFRKGSPVPQAQPSDDRVRLLSALLAANWNKSKAAERLQWSRMTVYRKMAKYHIADRDVTPNVTPK